ncbi:Uncharacterized protein family, UPF0114 [Musa troglodytarum]|uniref:Uncharacterized protein family, UPF0114 n=1 Tax=Musa troglodytarum TaxID=320322 RepID=A0A9E7GPQ1_9LILI|nr:Uncharacterized protein family, UPF0114 [Musa troglodytarum]
MSGASRLLRTTRALRSDGLPSSSSCSRLPPLRFPWRGGEKKRLAGCQGRKKVAAASDATVVLPDTKQKPSSAEGMEIAHLSKLADAARRLLNPSKWAVWVKNWRTVAEILIEKGITGCRSFTLIAVAGSLIGSILCFVEGCFFVLESYCQYFQPGMDQGGIVQPLVEAIDMFLVGTALLTFGISLYVMFASSEEMKQKRGWRTAKSCFGSFNLKKLADSMEMQSISHAKSRLGHAVLLILQTGVVDKFKNVQLASGMDLACFAAAVFVSSACVFLLSKLSMQHSKNEQDMSYHVSDTGKGMNRRT